MNETARRAICRLMAAAVLVSQLIVSAHACPVMTPGAAQPMAPIAQPAMADCDMLDPSAPDMNVQCAQHCNYGQQADQAQPATVGAAVLICLYPAAPPPAPDLVIRATALSAALAPSPPHAILHCCRRT